MGAELTAADVQMSFVGEVARAFGRLADKPDLNAWVDRLHARAAYKRALERGGDYNLGR
jgi:glutathione S-transferase